MIQQQRPSLASHIDPRRSGGRTTRRRTGLAALVLVAVSAYVWAPPREVSRPDTERPSSATGAVPESAQTRAIYHYSVVPGGVYSGDEVALAMTDPVVADHYDGLVPADVRRETVASDRFAYVSYRKDDKIYWTRNKVRISAGETMLTDGTTEIRARCGNCVSSEPQLPVSESEPDPRELERTGAAFFRARGPRFAVAIAPPLMGVDDPGVIAPEEPASDPHATTHQPVAPPWPGAASPTPPHPALGELVVPAVPPDPGGSPTLASPPALSEAPPLPEDIAWAPPWPDNSTLLPPSDDPLLLLPFPTDEETGLPLNELLGAPPGGQAYEPVFDLAPSNEVPSVVPEGSTLSLFLAGGSAMLAWLRRRRGRNRPPTL